MRVATLNVHHLRSPDRLAAKVREHGQLDVLAVQEACSAAATAKFAAALEMRVAVEHRTSIGLSNLILVREDEMIGSTVAFELACNQTKESRTAVAVWLPRFGLHVVCTHLDHQSESTRLIQVRELRHHLSAAWSEGRGCLERLVCHVGKVPFLMLGDMNSLRRGDYDEEEWQGLCASRAKAGIASETAVIEELEGAAWRLADCRSIAEHVGGSTATCTFGSRVDYVLASLAARDRWRAAAVYHVDLEPDCKGIPVTDHRLVVCELTEVTAHATCQRGRVS